MTHTERKKGQRLLILSIASRICVLLLLVFFAGLTEYINLKIGYNSPRLVELSSGKAMRLFYEFADFFFSLFGDPVKIMQTNGGMTWSIRVFSIPFTDPIAFLAVLTKNHSVPLGFTLGLTLPLAFALLFGRVFCAYICPASLVFYVSSRIRKFLQKYLYLPDFHPGSGLSWGILMGGLLLTIFWGYSVWAFLLPYLTIGKTIFNGIAFGVLSFSLISLVLFVLADLVLGKQFTCRYMCPTGRLLGTIGAKSVFRLRRDANECIDQCHACEDICPMGISPKKDDTVQCSLCGECMVICPSQCLDIRNVLKENPSKSGATI